MSAIKKIVFLTGTRADFGKLKSLIEIATGSEIFDVHIFATGMHMQARYGGTVNEIEKCGYRNIYKFINHTKESSMDLVLARTIEGLSGYCQELQPDMIVIHGDRVEALAGAIVGSLNNILVCHIEGGEVSGTIDELIRHSVSKMSHIHLVANDTARNRLVQMGEDVSSVFVIGSPDVDVMMSENLPDLTTVLSYYEIAFKDYGIVMFHPVTTEEQHMEEYANQLVDALVESGLNYVIIYPNNDQGSSHIFRAYERLEGLPSMRMFPSIRFESFLTLLKNANLIVGNSSSGIREAPYYGVPSVNIGSRQHNRAIQADVINSSYDSADILAGIKKALHARPKPTSLYGSGKSNKMFYEILCSGEFWKVNRQKHFRDLAEWKS